MATSPRRDAGRKGTKRKPAGRKSEARASQEKNSPPAAPTTRDTGGRFVKGVSGNPSGQHVVTAEIRELARRHGPEAIERLVLWMRSADPQASIMAAKILLERGFGKSIQPISAPNGGALVNLNFGAPIATAEEAAAAYAALCRDPSLDISALKFAAPKPALIEQRSNTKDIADAK
jgi:hypothetical protein